MACCATLKRTGMTYWSKIKDWEIGFSIVELSYVIKQIFFLSFIVLKETDTTHLSMKKKQKKNGEFTLTANYYGICTLWNYDV